MLGQEPTPALGLLCCRASQGDGDGAHGQLFSPSVCTEETQRSGIKGALPLRPRSHFKDTRVAEQCHLADGRSCLGEGERLALLPSQRENIFSELEKGKSVLFCLEAADGPNIPVLPDRFVGHTPSRAQSARWTHASEKMQLSSCNTLCSFCGFSDPLEAV